MSKTSNRKAYKITYEGNEYIVFVINTKKNGVELTIPFMIDYDDYEKCKKNVWYLDNNHICSSKMTNGIVEYTYLSQLIMNNQSGGKLQANYINKIPFDNRKENLRLVTQTEQNHNRTKQVRQTELPENCGFTPDDIPQCVAYVKSTDTRGDYFEVGIRKDGKYYFS